MKDVANDLLLRKYGTLAEPAPGQNFSLIRTQWDKWKLDRYHGEFGASRPVPLQYTRARQSNSRRHAGVGAQHRISLFRSARGGGGGSRWKTSRRTGGCVWRWQS